jgi:hypothetical protein
MKRVRLTRVLIGLAFGLSALAGAVPATATPNVATGVGFGTYLPGVPTTGCANEQIDFTLSPFVAGPDVVGTETFDGNGFECLQEGRGNGNLYGTLPGPLAYDRQGTVMTVSGTGTLNGQSVSFSGDCHLTFTSANPVTSFNLACTWLLN